MSIPPKCVCLLVEDNPADVTLMRVALSQSAVPVQLHAVPDGMAALTWLRHEGPYAGAPHPALVLLDLNLPKKHGHTVLAELKKDAGLRHIPVLIFSGSITPEDVARSYELGANAHVGKPIGLQAFFTVIRDLVQFWCHEVSLPTSLEREESDKQGPKLLQ